MHFQLSEMVDWFPSFLPKSVVVFADVTHSFLNWSSTILLLRKRICKKLLLVLAMCFFSLWRFVNLWTLKVRFQHSPDVAVVVFFCGTERENSAHFLFDGICYEGGVKLFRCIKEKNTKTTTSSSSSTKTTPYTYTLTDTNSTKHLPTNENHFMSHFFLSQYHQV